MTSNTQLGQAAGQADLKIEDPQSPEKRLARLFGDVDPSPSNTPKEANHASTA